MESCFYETIHETDLLHVRFEQLDALTFVFPAHWHELSSTPATSI